jgi:hypothetical protein
LLALLAYLEEFVVHFFFFKSEANIKIKVSF